MGAFPGVVEGHPLSRAQGPTLSGSHQQQQQSALSNGSRQAAGGGGGGGFGARAAVSGGPGSAYGGGGGGAADFGGSGGGGKDSYGVLLRCGAAVSRCCVFPAPQRPYVLLLELCDSAALTAAVARHMAGVLQVGGAGRGRAGRGRGRGRAGGREGQAQGQGLRGVCYSGA